MNSHSANIRTMLEVVAPGPILIHSDVFRAMGLVAKTTDAVALLQRHLEFLESATSGRNVYFPAFNYDFPKTRKADPVHDVSQAGALSEYARVHWASWRDGTPIFSFCGRNRPPSYQRIDPQSAGEIDPFDHHSLFHHLYQTDGAVMMYGAPFSRFTAIHYIERSAGGPLYRYDKYFPGVVRTHGGDERNVILKYHVRPQGLSMDYAWIKLLDGAKRNDFVIDAVVARASIVIVRFRKLCDGWLSMLAADPFVLLDEPSRAVAETNYRRLGRRFKLDDFE